MRIRFVMSSAKEYDALCKKLGRKWHASKRVWLAGFVGWGKEWRQLRNRTVYVGFSEVSGASRDMKISFIRLLNRIVDHELLHAFMPSKVRAQMKDEEAFARRFECAGDWARRRAP